MDSFDSEGNMKFILEEIKKADTFYNSFQKEFSGLLLKTIRKFYPNTSMGDEIENLLLAYSVAILNSTESVIDKDRNYPFYRLEEELESMNRITLNFFQEAEYNDFGEAVHLKAKKMMVKHFAAIYDLSSNGFRLLEKNARLYNWEFVSNFQAIFAAKVE